MVNAATESPSVGQLTAENLSVDAENGITYGYRRFGAAASGRAPLVFLRHFRGNLDNWDPLLVDEIAAKREAILLDNTGVGLSSANVPCTVTEMARDAISFLDALELGEVDLLGYSLGGMVAQELALFRPRTVRRVVLAGTGPRGGGHQMHGWFLDIDHDQLADSRRPHPECAASDLPRRGPRVSLPVPERARRTRQRLPRRLTRDSAMASHASAPRSRTCSRA